MSLQSIINRCSGISINRRKMAGIQYTKSELPRVSITPTFNPWKISLEMSQGMRYSDARAILEELDRLDRTTPETVTFGSNQCLSWIFRYQGAMSLAQVNAITVTSFTGNQLVLGNLPSVAASTVLFEPNDLIQIGTKAFPFTSTTQVLRGSGSTVTVTTHRPNILTNTVAGQNIVVGNSCQFRMFCPTMPTYKLIPGGALYSSNGLVLNNARIEFSGEFDLYEFVADA